MAFIDYYETLGVSKDSDAKEIKKAFRKLGRKYHPDVNPGDQQADQKFKQINEAHEVLSDPEKRKKYDKYGEHWEHADAYEQTGAQYQQRRQRQGEGFGDPGGGQWQQFTYSGDSGDFSDFFNEMFGRTGRQSGDPFGQFRSMKGQDFNARVELQLTDILESQKQVLDVNGNKIRISIPAGIEDGQTIRIKGQGGPGVQGGQKGDLYITFHIINNTQFERKGSQLLQDLPLDLYTAVLGGDVTVETLQGKLKIKIPAGTQPGEVIRLKGKGMPVYKKPNQYGDLLLTAKIDLPRNLNPQQKQLFEELAKQQYPMVQKNFIRLQQIIQYHGITRNEVTEWVEYEFFEIVEEEGNEFIREDDLDKIERIIRLYRDLGVNSPGIDIILRLREKLERLQRSE